MSLDLRPLTTNATAEVLQEIAADHALRAEILWAFVVILHFAALLPLDPIFVHVFVALLSWAAPGRAESDDGTFNMYSLIPCHDGFKSGGHLGPLIDGFGI